ncbi:MAG: hypothetical protein DRP59_03295, partial [Spirochaetes bacterium]
MVLGLVPPFPFKKTISILTSGISSTSTSKRFFSRITRSAFLPVLIDQISFSRNSDRAPPMVLAYSMESREALSFNG